MTDELIEGRLTIDGVDRTFGLRLPATKPAGPTPLVLVLHGNQSSSDMPTRLMRDWTSFDRQADRLGWAVVYPDGHTGSWADGRGVTTADEAGVDDVAFLRGIVDWACERHGTVPDRAVIAGISNGAFMAHRVGTAGGDRFAVLAAVAGTMPAALLDVSPTHAVSALLIHGQLDRFAPLDGGFSRHLGPNGELRGRTVSLDDTTKHWRSVDRCAAEPVATHTTELSGRTEFAGGIGGTRVTAWTVFNGGHTWPGTPVPPDIPEVSTMEFDAAEEICRFAAPLLIPAADRRR